MQKKAIIDTLNSKKNCSQKNHDELGQRREWLDLEGAVYERWIKKGGTWASSFAALVSALVVRYRVVQG